MRLSNPWLALIGERLKTPEGQEVDYWRIERADSAIIVPVWRQQFVLPSPMYRPGVGEVTLDFPGGRVPANQTPVQAASQILQRELPVGKEAILSITPLNQDGWPVNSSLSNQRLYGFWTQLRDSTEFAPAAGYQYYPCTQAGIERLLKVLPCLQCRAVLMTLKPQLNL